MSEQLAIRPKASQQLASFIGMEPQAMLNVIKAQCFKGNPANVTDEQLAAFVSIANEMGVNPLLPGMLYAFPVQGGGIVPMMGPDGVYKKLAEHRDIESWETKVFPEDVSLPPTHAITSIWRNGRERPLTYTALVSEWKIGQNPNWSSRPRHMIAIRSLKQCARQIIHGVPYDEDERVIMGEINITPKAEGEQTETPPTRPAPPPRARKGAAAVVENPVQTKTVAAASDGKVIEANFTDVAAEPAKVEPTPPKAEVPPVAEAPAKPTPRVFLKDAEQITAICEVTAINPIVALVGGKETPVMFATVKGDFNGEVVHVGGATGTTPEDLKPNAPWAVGARITAQLLGKLLKSTGKVQARVESVKAEVASASPAADLE